MDFYKAAYAEYPELAYFMPMFMGTLQLGDQVKAVISPSASTTTSMTNLTQESGTVKLTGALPSLPHPASLSQASLPVPRTLGHRRTPSPTLDPLLRIKGKALTTDTSVVLAAVTDGFSRPNILDLKLGSRLWANDAPLAKRQRLERVSRETTSISLGFRIAGMRIWQGERRQQPPDLTLSSNASDTDAAAAVVVEAEAVEEPVSSSGSSAMPTLRIMDGKTGAAHEDRHFEPETGYLFYNKLYGRSRTTEDIRAAFKEYFIVPSSGVDVKQALEVIRLCKEDVQEMQTALERVETRMFSSSILIVYEGDPEAWWEALEWRRKAKQKSEAENGNRAKTEPNLTETEELDGDTDDDEEPNTHAVKLIDFAHAEFVPGHGPDENVLHGVRTTVRLLEEIEAELKAELEV